MPTLGQRNAQVPCCIGAAGLWAPKLGEAGLHAHSQCIPYAPGSRPISLSPRPVAAAAQPPVCSGARTGACSCPGLPGCEQFHPAYDDQCTLGLAPPPLLLATRPPPPPLPPAHSSAPLCLPPLCREACTAFAPVPPPEHPTYDVYAVIDAALAEDAGDFGDISTNSTWVLAAVAPRRLASAAAPACLVAAARPAVHCSARAIVQLPGLHTCLLPAPTCRRVPEGTQASATFLAKAQGVLVRSIAVHLGGQHTWQQGWAVLLCSKPSRRSCCSSVHPISCRLLTAMATPPLPLNARSRAPGWRMRCLHGWTPQCRQVCGQQHGLGCSEPSGVARHGMTSHRGWCSSKGGR